MIRNNWYAILDSKEVPSYKPVGFRRLGENLVFWRDKQGMVHCYRDSCPHRGAALSKGKLIHDSIQCPFHGLEFNPQGSCTYIPSYGKNGVVPKAFHLTGYPLREKHGLIWLWFGDDTDPLPPIRFFPSLTGNDYSYAGFQDHWKTHYSRAIENQLDVVHLPFVHHNTIGAGNQRLVDGPIAEWDERDENLLNLWVFNRVDDGTLPKKSSELPRPEGHPSLQFRFPNIWQNWINDDFRVFIAFVPVDEENTILYIRNYQRNLRIPGIRSVVNTLSLIGSWVIERQDKRVVETQVPLRTYHRMPEILIRGDSPIVLYRKRRAE